MVMLYMVPFDLDSLTLPTRHAANSVRYVSARGSVQLTCLGLCDSCYRHQFKPAMVMLYMVPFDLDS